MSWILVKRLEDFEMKWLNVDVFQRVVFLIDLLKAMMMRMI